MPYTGASNTDRCESRRGATSHQFNRWFAVSEAGKAGEAHGEVWFGALAWSGSWKITAEINSADRLQVAGGIHDIDFTWQLKPGETLDRLRAKHSRVLWESCSGGGGRADLGILRRTDQVWTSDNTDPLDRLLIQNGYTYAYAPKTQVAWVTDNPDGINRRDTPLSFRFHCAMMGTLGLGGNLLKWTDDEAAQTKWFLAEYKQIRPLVQEGQLYRLRPSEVPPSGGFGDNGFWAYEFVSADCSSAVLISFLRSSQLGNDLPAIRLRGLKPDARYRVEARQRQAANLPLAAQTLSGAALMDRGLVLRMRGDYQSAMVRMQEVR